MVNEEGSGLVPQSSNHVTTSSESTITESCIDNQQFTYSLGCSRRKLRNLEQNDTNDASTIQAPFANMTSSHMKQEGRISNPSKGNMTPGKQTLSPFKQQSTPTHSMSLRRRTHQSPSLSSNPSSTMDSSDQEEKEFKESAVKECPSHLSYPWWHRNRLVYYHYRDTHVHLRDNTFIYTGYRMDYTYLENFISIFHIHNETGNIWTHLIPFFFCLYWIWESKVWLGSLITSIESGTSTVFTNLSPTDLAFQHFVVICGYLACNCITFITSALFHTHLCHKRHDVFIFFGCLDYSGISATICGSTCAVAYYLFYCKPTLQKFWICALGIPNLVGVIGPMFRFWGRSEFRGYRTLIYILSATISTLPIIHFLLMDNINNVPVNAISGVLGMAFFYLFGAFLYVRQWPERFLPGYFDYFGHSHQIWHLCVVAAAYWHLQAILALMKWRLYSNSCSSAY